MGYDHDLLKDYNPDVIVWSIRAFYIFASYAILIVRFIPDLRSRFLNYGARADSAARYDIKDSVLPRWFRIQFDPVLDWLADITVPHSWFRHFYICSSLCSAYWLFAHLNLAHYFPSAFELSLTNPWEYRTMWARLLLQLQGLRRLYECVHVAKPSRSRMWVGHYVIGIAFYVVTDVAIWIEPALEAKMSSPPVGIRGITPLVILDAARVTACILIFFYSSYKQYQVHAYLAGLKEYRVPDHPIFEDTNLVCPHYGYEVNIYVALTMLTARDTRILNTTMLCATSFVVINLGVTADMTKKWQMQKFPKQRPEIAKRRRMLGSIW
ncbi:hypothetical protein LTR70_000416 [Exophiala xenobiotica]|uniref:Polyprenal reductase n=1 Tax=Lithohypha guttulata TaxID=1690604 RepID=A0ABR0KQU7_9EURO|nr:hypothetical protein LTR24_000117 [Lithohypha guttulata]KAK5330586.1 hypothetical protein LTR70_000416 [Exophiala xenobiotica]